MSFSVSDDSESVSNAGKTSNEALLSYPCSGAVSKIRPSGSLDGLRPEASAGQVGRRSRAGAAPTHDAAGARVLGLEGLKSRLRPLRGDSPPLEIVPDGRVSVAAVRHTRRAVAGEAGIVDEPGSTQSRDGLLDDRLVDAAPRESRP